MDLHGFDQVCYRHSVMRKIPARIRVIQVMLYMFVGIFTFLGMFIGFPMLVPTLGTLIFAYWYMGIMRVEFEYRLDGTEFTVIRHSGVRQRPRQEEFLKFDMRTVEAVGYPDSEELAAIEERTAQANPRRVICNVSAQDVNRDSAVLYARGKGQEEGRWVKVYFEPENELMGYVRRMCPGKVFIERTEI